MASDCFKYWVVIQQQQCRLQMYSNCVDLSCEVVLLVRDTTDPTQQAAGTTMEHRVLLQGQAVRIRLACLLIGAQQDKYQGWQVYRAHH